MPANCCNVGTSPKIKKLKMQVPTVSPKILMEITVAASHFKSQLKITCPKIVATKAKPKKSSHVLVL